MEEEKNFSCFSISLLLGMDFSYSTRSRRGKKGTGECRRNLKNDDFNGDTEVGEDNRGEKKDEERGAYVDAIRLSSRKR